MSCIAKLVSILSLASLLQACVDSMIEQTRAKVTDCTCDMVASRRLLDRPVVTSSKIQCVNLCIRDDTCNLAAYKVLNNGQATCAKYSVDGVGLATQWNVTDMQTCSMMQILSPQCQNGGQWNGSICLCRAHYTGQTCEMKIPSHSDEYSICGDAASTIGPLFGAESTSGKSWKVRAFDSTVNTYSIYKIDSVKFDQSPSFEACSVLSVSRRAWDQFSPAANRMFYRFWAGNGNSGISGFSTSPAHANITLFDRVTPFTILLSNESRFRLELDFTNYTASSPSELVLKDYITKGYEILNIATIRYSSSQPVLESAFQDFLRPKVESEPFNWHFYKHLFAGSLEHLYVPLLEASAQTVSSEPFNLGKVYIDPSWQKVGSKSFLTTDAGKDRLNAYLQKGHSFRMNVIGLGAGISSVIRIQDKFNFFLPAMIQDISTGPYSTDFTYELKFIMHLSGEIYRCPRKFERDGEILISSLWRTNDYDLFVDDRNWLKLYQVFSNSSVAHGDVTELAKAVWAGKDMNIWVHWFLRDINEFFPTQLNTVSAHGQVSSESMTLWWHSSVNQPLLQLTSRCGYKKILVSSEGRMEIMQYDITLTGTITVETDVMITWFSN